MHFGAMSYAVATLVLAGAGADPKAKEKAEPTSKDTDKVECHGINSCKGKGECGGPGYECAGNNSCKGQGWLTKTKAECLKAGGKFKEAKGHSK